jgi:hypothetical protein
MRISELLVLDLDSVVIGARRGPDKRPREQRPQEAVGVVNSPARDGALLWEADRRRADGPPFCRQGGRRLSAPAVDPIVRALATAEVECSATRCGARTRLLRAGADILNVLTATRSRSRRNAQGA